MNLFKQLWVYGLRRVRDEYEDAQDDIVRSSPLIRFTGISACVYLFVGLLLGIYWSYSPSLQTAHDVAQRVLREQHLNTSENIPVGAATTASLIAITEVISDKSGGYITNDKFLPGVWLDNMPHWELGAVLQVRDMTEMLRASFSQASANIIADDDLQKAEARFNFDHDSWAFPATESQYNAGAIHLKKYLFRLVQPDNSDTFFYADAQHLNDYLAGVEQRLKSLSQRLTASVGPEINTDTAAMSVSKLNASGLYKQTPWLELDDVFYEARGSTWALIVLLKGLEIDFEYVLHEKNAKLSYEQIIRELQSTQKNIYSPIILNGDGFGFVANHSLVMASYISRTQAAVADCRRLLLKPAPISSPQ